MKNQPRKSFVILLVFFLGMACVPTALTQTFKHVKVKGGAPLVEVASGSFATTSAAKLFEQVPGSLSLLRVGGDGVRGVNANSAIFRFNFATGGFVQLTNLTVGPNGFWGLFTDQIYRFYDDIQNFAQLPGSLIAIQAGGDGVWGVDAVDQVFRLEPCTSTFVQIPGKFFYVAVGSGAGVCAISPTHEVYTFSIP